MKFNVLVTLILSFLLLSCENNSSPEAQQAQAVETDLIQEEDTPEFQNEGHRLVYNMVQKAGNYGKLREKNDVVYTYTYERPDGKTDVSTEKYRFDGELSYGAYQQHERTFPQLEGLIEQGYDGNEFWLKHQGKTVEDDQLLKRVAFGRKTNFYWFAMMQKLLDPGLTYEYVGKQTIADLNYDVVKVSFASENNKPTDIYQLYLHPTTGLVDQFLFTVADFGVMEAPNLMILEYEEIDGILIPNKRLYKKSTWDAEVSDEPWIKVTWSDIKFDNGLTVEDFKTFLSKTSNPGKK